MVFAPGVALFRMSTPLVVGLLTAICTPGFPATTFLRMIFPSTPASTTIPFVFPTTMLSTMTLSLGAPPMLMRPMPKLLPWVAYPFPLNRFARTRLRLAPPVSHMPPHGLETFPFRTEIFASSSLSEDPVVTKSPVMQLVDAVT